MEGLYKRATAPGYDQDCDGNYDTNADVKPFIATKPTIRSAATADRPTI
jgi:hypothetical protein